MIAKITFQGQSISVPCAQVRPYKHTVRLWNVPETSFPDIDALLPHFSIFGNSILISNRDDIRIEINE